MVVLRDHCLFRLYSESFVISWLQTPETDSKRSIVEYRHIGNLQVEALRTLKAISRPRLMGILR